MNKNQEPSIEDNRCFESIVTAVINMDVGAEEAIVKEFSLTDSELRYLLVGAFNVAGLIRGWAEKHDLTPSEAWQMHMRHRSTRRENGGLY